MRVDRTTCGRKIICHKFGRVVERANGGALRPEVPGRRAFRTDASCPHYYFRYYNSLPLEGQDGTAWTGSHSEEHGEDTTGPDRPP